LQNQDLSAFLGVVVFGIFIVQRLPYEKQIPLKDIQKINIRELRSFTGKYSLLTIHLKDKAINIVPAQNFKQEVVDLISSHAE
jgi:flagellar biogenesis protein FliO